MSQQTKIMLSSDGNLEGRAECFADAALAGKEVVVVQRLQFWHIIYFLLTACMHAYWMKVSKMDSTCWHSCMLQAMCSEQGPGSLKSRVRLGEVVAHSQPWAYDHSSNFMLCVAC